MGIKKISWYLFVLTSPNYSYCLICSVENWSASVVRSNKNFLIRRKLCFINKICNNMLSRVILQVETWQLKFFSSCLIGSKKYRTVKSTGHAWINEPNLHIFIYFMVCSNTVGLKINFMIKPPPTPPPPPPCCLVLLVMFIWLLFQGRLTFRQNCSVDIPKPRQKEERKNWSWGLHDCLLNASWVVDFPGNLGATGSSFHGYGLQFIYFNETLFKTSSKPTQFTFRKLLQPSCFVNSLLVTIVNRGKWLWNPAKFFVVCFFAIFHCILGVDSAQNLAKYNRWLRVFMQLTNRNISIT